jgi:hypothetical protein
VLRPADGRPGPGTSRPPGAVVLLAEAEEDPGLGLADGGRRHAQLGGDDGGRLAVDGGPPERLPGALLELAADQFQGPEVQAAEVLLGVVGQSRFGDLLHLAVGGGAARGVRPVAPAAEVVQELVTGDAAQPAPEGVPGPVAAEVVQARDHRLEDLHEPDEEEAWLNYARLLVLRGEVDGYRRLGARMRAHFRGDRLPNGVPPP